MVVSQENWLALWMRMGIWARFVEPFQATLSLSTEERSLGVPRGRKLFPCRLPKASTLLLPTQLKKLSGSVNSSFNSSIFFFLRHLFSATINLPSPWKKTTSITHALNISMFDFTLSVGSSKTVNYDLFIALPMKWFRMFLKNHGCLKKSRTFGENTA